MSKELNVAIIPGPGFDDLDWAVYMRMQELGATVTTLGIAAGDVYESKAGGLTTTVQHASSEVKAADLDAIIGPGGWGRVVADIPYVNRELAKALGEE